MLNISDHISDRSYWAKATPEYLQKLGVWPNQLWHDSTQNLGVLVIFKLQRYEEYPVSKAGLDYVLKAHNEKRIVGHVVLCRGHAWKLTLVASKEVVDVAAAVEGVPPRDGPYGPYWWFHPDLTLDGSTELGF